MRSDALSMTGRIWSGIDKDDACCLAALTQVSEFTTVFRFDRGSRNSRIEQQDCIQCYAAREIQYGTAAVITWSSPDPMPQCWRAGSLRVYTSAQDLPAGKPIAFDNCVTASSRAKQLGFGSVGRSFSTVRFPRNRETPKDQQHRLGNSAHCGRWGDEPECVGVSPISIQRTMAVQGSNNHSDTLPHKRRRVIFFSKPNHKRMFPFLQNRRIKRSNKPLSCSCLSIFGISKETHHGD